MISPRVVAECHRAENGDIHGGGSAARISKDPGGGEAWLTAPLDTAMTQSMFQPKP